MFERVYVYTHLEVFKQRYGTSSGDYGTSLLKQHSSSDDRWCIQWNLSVYGQYAAPEFNVKSIS